MREALAVDPASPVLGMQVGRIEYYRRSYARAVEQLEEVLDREPGFRLARYYLGLSYAFLGRAAEAESSLSAAGLSAEELTNHLLWVRVRSGRREMADNILRSDARGTGALFLAIELNETDVAFRLLEEAAEIGSSLMLALRVDPRFDAIREDSRFAQLLARTNRDEPEGELLAQSGR